MSFRERLQTSYQNEEKISQDSNSTETLGVDGKFKWPIRIFTPILFGCTLLVNYLLGVNRNKQVSDKFYLWVTPPGFFFIIWAFIYTGLAIANIFNLVKNVWNFKTHVFFGITNVLNIIWTLVFNVGTLAAVVVSSVILITLTVFIFLTWVQIGNIGQKNINIFTYIMRNIFAFYLGWCIAASNINFGMDIVYWWGGNPKAQMIVFWIMAPLCAVGAFSYIILKQGKYGVLSSFCVWLSVGWAFVGAAITSNKCLNGEC